MRILKSTNLGSKMIKQVFSFLSIEKIKITKNKLLSFFSIWLEKRVELLMATAGIITIMAALSAGITDITGMHTISSISIVVLGIGVVILIALGGRETILFRRTCEFISRDCERQIEDLKRRDGKWKRIDEMRDATIKRISTTDWQESDKI